MLSWIEGSWKLIYDFSPSLFKVSSWRNICSCSVSSGKIYFITYLQRCLSDHVTLTTDLISLPSLKSYSLHHADLKQAKTFFIIKLDLEVVVPDFK